MWITMTSVTMVWDISILKFKAIDVSEGRGRAGFSHDVHGISTS